ncbi:MAG: hypothetical protein H6719_17295 [Sandaracinaceae bacterium]|nr:hypothetical protein [Sandaracinaceae bacterium]
MQHRRAPWLGVAWVLVGVLGCDGGGADCPLGASVACTCPDGTTGSAVCEDEGVVGVCVCATDAGSSGSDASTPDAGGADAGAPDAAAADAGSDAGACADPHLAGFAQNGVGSTDFGMPWTYLGELGLAAGESACQAIGADHVCRYVELLEAETCGELVGAPASLWLQRETSVDVDGATIEPGPGARCNDWTGPIDQIADGEYAEVGSDGSLTFFFDTNPCYTGIISDGCAGPGLSCNETRAIPCCN